MNESSQNSVLVSAIVPARNEEAVIAACVEFAGSSKSKSAEILVINDQSTDHTAAIVRQQ